MLYAIYLDEHGYDHQLIYARRDGLIKGNKYKIERISMGQSNTSLHLGGFEHGYNTVMFNIVDEDGKEYDIFSDPNYNPYL